MIITLENVDRLLYFLHCCRQEEILYTYVKKCPPRLKISFLHYLVKMKHHISYFSNAHLEQHLLREA